MSMSRLTTYLWYGFLILILVISLNYLLYLTSLGIYFSVPEGNSMEPNLSGGDVLLHQPPNNLEVGDIVSFEPDEKFDSNYDGRIVHRIIEIDKSRDRPYKIKGDNNEGSDGWFKKEQIKSKVSLKLWNAKFLLPIIDYIPKT
jgi:signal peptidase I